MKNIKITNGIIRKIEKRLKKIIMQQYCGDGLYLYISSVKISSLEETTLVDYTIEWGRDGENAFHNQTTLCAGDGNLNFIAGQFFEKLLTD